MIKVRDFDLSIKAVADDGFFSGYGSVFGVVDTYNEVVAPGAFAATLTDRKARNRPVPILWQHRSDSPLGTYSKVEEDDKGLYVEGRLLTADVAKAREAHALMKAGAVTGLSIGFWLRESSYDEKTGVRTLTRVDLEEVSIVTMPANDDARIDAIKMKLAHGGLPTLPEFERLLREAGFSRSQSAVIANRGLKHLLSEPADPANATAASDLVKALQGFSLPSI
ncbi:MAG: HK97 family phage prohead protease [Mesorhizobium sp.]|uniref:HK97 family phage prohead protease n=1 Tax=Mesorhizobium sp. TaxID=1871066 RepID=UPI0011F6964B|nr:HK97 family phage prohead protease [Mesorhizobium sp.]TIO52990.1 MAG: HK97 family phage prohead protease [Mesorhizobium sp.]TIO61823.1 MAG: HK97 family phage prohead protease [Mesorhizobium sp.]TJV66722.1 MAG: HK97 family phage prohead protease [Mesorhizobium sp.]